MEITLTPEIEELLKKEMETGDYVSNTDILREGLLLLRSKKIPAEVKLENLKSEIYKGINAVKQKNFQEYNTAEELIEEVIVEAHAEFNSKNK